MPLYQAIILALVQAVTEFLPISSTAHLALIPWVLRHHGWQDPGLEFDVALHLGTLLAVLVYFWRLWVRVLFAGFGLAPPVAPAARAPAPGAGDVAEDEAVADRRLLWLLVLGTIPAAVAGVALEKYVKSTLRSPFVMAASLIVVALLMAYGDRIARLVRSMKDLRLSDAVAVGCAQVLSLIPGVSRSGITITAALFGGFRRDSAARFSFLLATPVIGGAAAMEGHHLLKHGIPAAMRLPFLAGVLVAAVAGYAVIEFLIRYLQTRTLRIFVYYRLVFGFIILTLAIFSSAP
jgi:undecaprenyl-diphosphatase